MRASKVLMMDSLARLMTSRGPFACKFDGTVDVAVLDEMDRLIR